MFHNIVSGLGRLAYKYSGLKSLIDYIDLKVTNYRIRLNIVPVTYKLFLVALGAVGMYGWQSSYILYQAEAQNSTIVVEQAPASQAIETPKVDPLDTLAKTIWERESTKGKQNYSKCEAQGKINGIGYGIAGDGKYICFSSHEEEMQALKGWLIAHKASGMSETQMLCLYSGHHYKECN